MRTVHILLVSFSILSISFLVSCGGGETDPKNENNNLKDFYFPIESLSTPKVYHYTSNDPEVGDLFWKMYSFEKGGRRYFTTDAYHKDSLGQMISVEFLTEEINKKGAFVEELFTFETNENGELLKIEAKNRSKEVFLWEWDEDKPAVWSFSHESLRYSGYDREVRRERNFTDEFVTIKFKGKEHEAVTFVDAFSDIFTDQVSGDEDSFQFIQQSIYAKGIGLYQYSRFFPGESPLTFTLQGILSLDDWEKIQKQHGGGEEAR